MGACGMAFEVVAAIWLAWSDMAAVQRVTTVAL